VRFSQLLSALFLVALEMQIFVNNPQNWWSVDREISLTVRWLFLTQQQLLNCVNVFISTHTASATARTPVNCSELHPQPVDAVLRASFAKKLWYKLPSILTFTFIHIFGRKFVSFTEQRQSCCVCLIQRQNSRYFWCLVWKTKSW